LKEITLALGGGGAKGNAHFGVLRVLEREGFQIKGLAGTSAGGVFGAMYAAGYSPDEIIARLEQIDQSKLYGHKPGETPALLGTVGLEQHLYALLDDRTFDDLRIPFAVVAVDLHSGREVVLNQGRVIDALMATIALPGIFPPRQWGNYLLVDGGVLNNVPVVQARAFAPHLPVVAVVLSKPIEEAEHILSPVRLFDHDPLLKYITRLRVAQAFNYFINAIEIGSRNMTELRLKVDKPDVIIRPDVENIGLLDKVCIADVARKGEIAAEQALPALKQAVSWQGQLQRRLFKRSTQ